MRKSNVPDARKSALCLMFKKGMTSNAERNSLSLWPARQRRRLRRATRFQSRQKKTYSGFSRRLPSQSTRTHPLAARTSSLSNWDSPFQPAMKHPDFHCFVNDYIPRAPGCQSHPRRHCNRETTAWTTLTVLLPATPTGRVASSPRAGQSLSANSVMVKEYSCVP